MLCGASFAKRHKKGNGAQKAVVMAVDLQSICDVFPEIEQEPPKQTPYVNKEGEYVSANTGKTAKMACETSAD